MGNEADPCQHSVARGFATRGNLGDGGGNGHMKRLLLRWLHALRDYFDPPPEPEPSNLEFVEALKREAAPFGPSLTIADRIAIAKSMLPNDIQRDPVLREIAHMRLEQEIEAEYGEIRRDIERLNRPTLFTRKLHSVGK
jgi:hypothetical protein